MKFLITLIVFLLIAFKGQGISLSGDSLGGTVKPHVPGMCMGHGHTNKILPVLNRHSRKRPEIGSGVDSL